MTLLTPDFGLLFWMLISFGIVFGILARFGFPVITRMVDKRRDYIRKSLEVADEAHRKLKTVNTESERILDEAHRRQAEILRAAISESEFNAAFDRFYDLTTDFLDSLNWQSLS